MGNRLLTLTTGDELAGVDIDRLNKAVDKILTGGTMPTNWLSAALCDTASPVDDTVGMILNTDGNVWDTKLILMALLGVPYAVEQVQRTARGDFPKGSFVADNDFVRGITTDLAKALEPLCGSWKKADNG